MQILEREESGRTFRTRIVEDNDSEISRVCEQGNPKTSVSLSGLGSKVFLPAGYPRSVSPDYLRYQVLNSLQAFCSSLTELLSSRATLEGYGVGDPSASATSAVLLTVIRNIFGRLTVIISAYFFGSSLSPEAKTYRFLADILNDAAVILDTLSPFLSTLLLSHSESLSRTLPFLPPRVPLKVYTLCLSSSFRAVCAVYAGGSRAALAMHFATPLEGNGDVGDLNAKDASKVTVLVLLGMLAGSVIVPYLTTLWSTYSVLFVMVFLHLITNYLAVRGVVLRTLNRQRATIAWMQFRQNSAANVNTPPEIASLEHLFVRPDAIHGERNTITSLCIIGSSLESCVLNTHLFKLFTSERYVLSLDTACISASSSQNGTITLRSGTKPRFRIVFKEGYTSSDQLKAWVHACEVSRLMSFGLQRDQVQSGTPTGGYINVLGVTQEALRAVNELFPIFVQKMHQAGWGTTSRSVDPDILTPARASGENEGEGGSLRSSSRTEVSLNVALMTGPPKCVILDVLDDGALKKEV